MTIPSLPMDGCCRCGQVSIRMSKEPMLTSACHCTGCQKMTGSAYSLTVTVADDGFEVTKGKPVIGGMHGDVEHYHCPHCMSWIFTLPPDKSMGFVNVRATMLDDTRWFAPFMESFTSEKLSWATTSAKHSYTGFPPMEDYGKLIAAYSASGGGS